MLFFGLSVTNALKLGIIGKKTCIEDESMTFTIPLRLSHAIYFLAGVILTAAFNHGVVAQGYDAGILQRLERIERLCQETNTQVCRKALAPDTFVPVDAGKPPLLEMSNFQPGSKSKHH